LEGTGHDMPVGAGPINDEDETAAEGSTPRPRSTATPNRDFGPRPPRSGGEGAHGESFTPFEDEKDIALKEAADAIELVKKTDKAVELTPRRAFLRRLQHQMIEENNLMSFSVGDEPNRRLRIVPPVDDN
jgi:hypothetical protein